MVARALGAAPTFVEVGAGRGALARAVLDAGAWTGHRYVCVERAAVLRAAAAELVPEAEVRRDLPAAPVDGVVLANELLDNLPFRLFERRQTGWVEVGVAPDGGEVLAPADLATSERVERLAPEAPVGGRVPLQDRAVHWLATALERVRHGRVVVVDYADVTASLSRRPWLDWARTYRAHQRGGHPLDAPGHQDVTCEVAVDQLALVRPPDEDRTQAEWLSASGLDELVAEARATWHERAAIGDLAALRARSRVGEADALTDPTGLGAFRVLEWVVG
ncbi:hypothetical protein BH18ACT1_BH18ACT1_02680 [soil metagenome]